MVFVQIEFICPVFGGFTFVLDLEKINTSDAIIIHSVGQLCTVLCKYNLSQLVKSLATRVYYIDKEINTLQSGQTLHVIFKDYSSQL